MLLISLPLKEPVAVFAVILLAVLLAPMLISRLRAPGIIGLILAGLALGPHGLRVLEKNEAVDLLATIGLLYIMFLAGLDLEINDFLKNKHRSGWFGFFTFIIPLVIGFPVCYFGLHYPLLSSLLIASMFSTHTLISYPIVIRLGINQTEAVAITVGGTIFTDTLVLINLAVIAQLHGGQADMWYWLKFVLSLLGFSSIVLWGMMPLGRQFFKRVDDQNAHYLYVLLMVFIAALLAEWSGVEPIIGAFMAGLALNRLIPHNSALMNRIEFVGQTLFIPFFLLSVGMIIDLKILIKDGNTIFIALVLTAVALVGKWLAAWLTQRKLGYTSTERQLIFGLSSAHAAATLAIILVGYRIGLLDDRVLNGVILLILFTCLVSSFVTETAARKTVLLQGAKVSTQKPAIQRVLVPVSNPHTLDQLMKLSILLLEKNKGNSLFPVSVIPSDKPSSPAFLQRTKNLEKALQLAAGADCQAEATTIVDVNISNGLIRAARENEITDIVVGWHGENTPSNLLFGHVLDTLIQRTYQMLLVCRLVQPLNTTKRIIIGVPENAALEAGFHRWLNTAAQLARQTSSKLVFFGNIPTLESISQYLDDLPQKPSYEKNQFDEWQDFLILSRDFKSNDLLMIINARKGCISYDKDLDKIPNYVSKYFEKINFILIYPEKNPQDEID